MGPNYKQTDDVHYRVELKPQVPTGRNANFSKRLLLHIVMDFVGLLVRQGNIRLNFFEGEECYFIGDGDGEPVDIYFRRLPAMFRILLNPGLAIGETYVDGDWDIDEADLTRFIGYLLANEKRIGSSPPLRAIERFRSVTSLLYSDNTSPCSRTNASHHYDLGNDLFESFLDDEMVYSCAFFSDDAQSLEEAQKSKLETTLDRLKVKQGMRVLDIGCGWGALTRMIAARDARAVGITLADRQLALAEQRIPHGFRNKISYQLQDYRDHAANHREAYDRIVSIGMFEHVGRRHFVEYFDAIFRMLKPGGRALVHSIVKPERSGTNAWIAKYIFPGGLIPQIADMTGSAESAGLLLPHKPFIHESHQYAQTLRHWRKRFNQNFASLDRERYDDRFRRLWNFYLASSEAAFDTLGYEVAQMVVEKPEL